MLLFSDKRGRRIEIKFGISGRFLVLQFEIDTIFSDPRHCSGMSKLRAWFCCKPFFIDTAGYSPRINEVINAASWIDYLALD